MMFFLILWIFLEPLLCSNSRCDNYTHKSSWLSIFGYRLCLFLLVFHELSAEPLSLSIDFYPPGVTFPSSTTHVRRRLQYAKLMKSLTWLTPLWHTESDTQMKGGWTFDLNPMACLWNGGISSYEPCLGHLQAFSSCLPVYQSVPVAITIPLFHWSFDLLTDPLSVVLLTTQTSVPWAVIFN